MHHSILQITENQSTDNQQATNRYETIITQAKDAPHHYESVSDHYSKGEPTDLMEQSWFHGKLTEEQAESALSIGNVNTFLVQQIDNSLILSSSIQGWRHHHVINRSPRGYCLEGKNEYFDNVSEMLKYYQKVPINDLSGQVLGSACDRKFSGND